MKRRSGMSGTKQDGNAKIRPNYASFTKDQAALSFAKAIYDDD